MKYVLSILAVFICWGTDARAFSCDDFYEVLNENHAKGEAYRSQFKTTIRGDASQCQFVRDIFIPYVDRSITKFIPYVQCPKHGKIVAELVENLKEARSILESGQGEVCK